MSAPIIQIFCRRRICRGLTQAALAEKLGVTEAALARDEYNEYYGITVERGERIFAALNASLTTQINPAPLNIPPLAREKELAVL